MPVIVLLQLLVPVPVADPFAHGKRAIEKLHEADAVFDQPPGQETIASEGGRQRVGVVGRIQPVRARAFFGEVADPRIVLAEDGLVVDI